MIYQPKIEKRQNKVNLNLIYSIFGQNVYISNNPELFWP